MSVSTFSDQSHHIDVAVVTVIPPENAAVSTVLKLAGIPSLTLGEGIEYRIAQVANKKSGSVSVAHFHAGMPGNTYMAALCARICLQLRPALVILVGIAAGIKKDADGLAKSTTKIGSLHLPKKVVDFSMTVLGVGQTDSGEERDRVETYSRNSTLDRQIGAITSDDVIREHKEQFAAVKFDKTEMANKLDMSPSDWKDFFTHHVDTKANISDKWLGSSNRLLRNPAKLLAWQKSHEDLVAADMESAGLAVACNSAKTGWMVIRGISDFGDKHKSDHFHALASRHAASFLNVLLKRGLEIDALDDRDAELQRALSATHRRMSSVAQTLRPFIRGSVNYQIYWTAKRWVGSEERWEEGLARDPDLRVQQGRHSRLHPSGFHALTSSRVFVRAATLKRTVHGTVDHPMLKWVCATPICFQDGRSGQFDAVLACAGEEDWSSNSTNQVSLSDFSFSLIPLANELCSLMLDTKLPTLRRRLREIR